MSSHNNSHNKEKNIIKLIFIVSLISLILVADSAYLSPQQGYEISFYSSTPSLVFALIAVAIVGGVSILVQQVVSGNYRSSRIWIGGFLLLVLTRMVTLYLPYIRGYFTWMGDNATHLGLVGEIVAKGYVDPKNFYPITHIFLTQVTLITALPVEFVVNHSTTILSVFYVLTVYLIAKAVFDDERPVILTVAAVGAVIFSGYELYLMPNGWSCLLLPLAVYLIIRSMDSRQNPAFKILALIAIVLYPFFHPFSTLLLILLLVLFIVTTFTFTSTIVRRVLTPISHSIGPESFLRFNNMPVFLVGIGITIWTLWIVSFRRFDSNIRNFADAILTSETFDAVGAMAEQADKMNFELMDILVLLVKDYGDELIFFATFLAGGLIFLRRRRYFSNAESIFLISILPLTFGLFYLVYLTGLIPGLDFISAQRVLPYTVLVAPIFSGIFFCYALSKKRSILTGFCILLLVITPILALFAVVPSPYLHRATPDITEMDLAGMEWSFQYKDLDLPYGYIMSPPFRFADIILGRVERDKRSDIDHVMKIPDHFAYGQNRYLGESYTNNSFAVITKFDTVLYETAYERVGRFRNEDFVRLQGDPTVNRIYSNDESTAYVIQAAG